MTVKLDDLVPVVKITGSSVRHEGTFKGRDGEQIEYVTKKQPGVLIRGDFREPYEVRLEADQVDYPPGLYYMDICAMLAVKNGTHTLNKFTKLIPIPASK